MFNNAQPNIILLTDNTDVTSMNKTIGPYKVAHELRNHGFEVAVINHLSVLTIGEIKHLLKNIISDQTLFVGVNNFYYNNIGQVVETDSSGIALSPGEPGAILPHGKKFNQEIRDLIKQASPSCKLVLGGPGVDDLGVNDIFNYILIGYSECSIVNLANHLMDQSIKLEKSYKSVFGPIVVNDSRAEGYNFSLGTVRYEDHDVVLPNETLVLEVGRGCIFKCAFCAYPMNGKKKLDFIKNAEIIYDELMDNFERFGVTRYVFCDDTFNDSVEKCQMIYDISKKLPFKLEWWGYIRLDLLTAHPQTVDWLIDSGLKSAHFGIETFNKATATAIGKGGDREKLLKTIRTIKEKHGNNINLHGTFIFGLPYEPMESLNNTKDFLLSDSNPLDSYQSHYLAIRLPDRNYSNEFLSDLDKNWAKYGYRNLNEGKPRTSYEWEADKMVWENDFTNFEEMKAMVADIKIKQKQQKTEPVNGLHSLYVAGLDLPIETTLNKRNSDIDWYSIDQQKLKRANEYKKLLFKRLNVPEYQSNTLPVQTYSEWLKCSNALVD
jgi:radical SAM superfamily enzyme YgiQ (UPF0313 family)